jgi:hypothetical protein
VSRFWAEPRRLLVEADALAVVGGAEWRRVGFDGEADAAFAASVPDALVPRGSRCQVLLADALVRYLVIQWPSGLRGRSERAAFVAHRFREVHAVTAPDWQIMVEPTAGGFPALACAAPAALIEAIAAWARRHRVRLAGLSGEFVAAYNRARPRVAHGFGALGLQRDGRLTIGMWHDAVWHALRSQPLGAGGDNAVGVMLASMRGRLGGEGGVLYCFGPMLDAPAGWRAFMLGNDAWD